MLKKWQPLLLSTIVLLSLCASTVSSSRPALTQSPSVSDDDVVALLAFKSKADLHNALPFSSNTTTLQLCRWPGVQCAQSKIVRLIIQSQNLGGIFAPNTLTRLDQLRVLSLQNNSLTGPIPDLSGLTNLKTLFLDRNSFVGSLPPSLSSLHRLRTLDFSFNNLTGPLPAFLITGLDRLYYLRLDWNRFTGPVPALNQSSLRTFNVSGNNLTGVIPVTPTLLRFGPTAFSWNPGLCGELVNKECHPAAPFFGPTPAHEAPPPTRALGQSTAQEVQGVELTQPSRKRHRRIAVIIGFSSGVFVLICSLLFFVMALKKQRKPQTHRKTDIASPASSDAHAAVVVQLEEELEQKVKRVQGIQVVKSGSLMFCAGESQLYSLDQLMRASAEMLGKGTIGTTYKAVLDNRLIVSVKRLDAGKLGGTSREVFERHMEAVGGLRHPNLVPLRAYFQAKDERLLVYDYQPNGSLFSLIHGTKSTRAKPLHWTSCLKIAEDVAQGLSYIHQAWRLVHGNLKSSNVLLGPDFEACLTDYCLSVLATTTLTSEEEPDSAAYKAPEIRINSLNDHDDHQQKHQPTSKSDVYAFGILLVELLTGKPPSHHQVLVPTDMVEWVMSMREDDQHDQDGEGNSRMGMLVEVAIACSSTSPEQRPTMWQVLKMLQEIKESASMEDDNELMDPQIVTGVP
ncbi:PREDICTED: probable [Prunus dulcis]|uniref:PREDICTED: probable n=1 Tax=Prunus dulcis TaxID=3755 RepID=A0A5E4E8C5_PRUDU|nr:probable inactive receptor kinase At5g67200 [Prunus dulcis]VVA12044.1 PREDICTED: probable [Prunus dulcis]